ncbi:MFS transporter [Aquibium carbonis]|uniref:MFS transporter n=1 Tax=Aquibium carbonis TaxID=2495581 RepID=UPI00147931E3|nr:MFS transporter [Aquibium carbonis]
MKDRWLVAYCGVLMSISSFSVDITLPSFPDMVADLATPFELVQWTITSYMIGAGVGQLFWGSASDRFGRRPILAAGLALFLLGCLGAAFAASIELMLACRVLQGLGAAAAIVSSRAIIRDRYSGEALARNLALATAIFAVGPIFAPLLGASVAALAGWRFIFLGLSVFAAGLLVVLVKVPETLPRSAPDALRLQVFGQRTARLFRHPQSRHFMLLSAVVMASMLFILASTPRIYEHAFGLSGTTFALYFAFHGLGIVAGQIANRRLILEIGIVNAMIAANLVLIGSVVLMLVAIGAGVMNAFVMTALLTLFATSYLIVYSNAAAMVLDPHGDIAGFAAAFYGFTSQIGSALIVSILVFLTGDSVAGFAVALLVICLVCFGALLAWRKQRRV